jgi:hypothetical protein
VPNMRTLVALRYVDEANLSNTMKWVLRGTIPVAAILVPAAFYPRTRSWHWPRQQSGRKCLRVG